MQSHALHALDVLRRQTASISRHAVLDQANASALRRTTAPVRLSPCVEPSILTQSLVQEVRILLGGLAVLYVAISVEHPCWDLELQGLADHRHDLVHLISGELAGALVQVNVALLAHLTTPRAPRAHKHNGSP